MLVLSEKDYNHLAGNIIGRVDMLIKDGHFWAYKYYSNNEDTPHSYISDDHEALDFFHFFSEYDWITGNDLHMTPKKSLDLKPGLMHAFFPEFIRGSMDPDYLAWREFLVISLPDPSTQP